MSAATGPGLADPSDLPLLSVVVPVYDVEQYLSECLDSVLGQSYARLEVIVVDDGSTDASAEVARRYAARDSRVQVVTQPNGGLGAARNTGARHATGRYLAFADSDDTVPPGAYQRLVRSLLETGSDLAVGAMEELVDGRYRIPTWLAPLHRRQQPGVRLDDAPDILHNAFAWDKVFSRAFWVDSGVEFPEGVFYEDHVPMTRAYLAARAIDVLPDVVYRWRTRTDGSSITQRKHELRNLVDALAAKREVDALIAHGASAATRRHWHTFMFDDLRPYVRHVPQATDEYWTTLRDGVRELLAQAGPVDLGDVAARVRLMVWLVAEDRRADVTTLLARLADGAARPSLVRVGETDTLWVDGLSAGAGVPPELFILARSDRQLRARLVEVRTPDPATVRLRCRLQLIGVCDRETTPAVSVRLRDQRGAADISVATTVEDESAGDAAGPAPGAPPPWRVSADLPLDLAPGVWTVDLVVTFGDVTVEGPFTGVTRPAEAALAAAPAGPGGLRANWHHGAGLRLGGADRG